jgi:hypothetical protein
MRQLERKDSDIQTKMDALEKENHILKDKHEQEMKSMREDMNKQFSQVMEMIQQINTE